MRLFKLIGYGLVGLFVSACAAPQPPVSLSQNFFQNTPARVGLAISQPEAPTFSTEGDVRLLDMAIIATAMAQFKGHVATLDLADFQAVAKEVTDLLQQKGFVVKQISPAPDMEELPSFSDPNTKDSIYFAEKDMTRLASQLGVDYLLSINLYRAGFARPYSGFVPLAAPRAVFDIRGQLVDLRDNRLLWYAGIHKANSAEGNWDEPPNFPGLTNSYYVTLEQTKEAIVATLANPVPTGSDKEQVAAKADK